MWRLFTSRISSTFLGRKYLSGEHLNVSDQLVMVNPWIPLANSDDIGIRLIIGHDEIGIAMACCNGRRG